MDIRGFIGAKDVETRVAVVPYLCVQAIYTPEDNLMVTAAVAAKPLRVAFVQAAARTVVA